MNQDYLQSVKKTFLNYKVLAEKSIDQVEATQLFVQPNENSNSIAVIMKHMAGNMISRWTDFLTTDGEKPDRNRDGEFENDVKDKDALLLYWEKGWKVFLETLTSLSPEDLSKTIYIRKEAHSVLEAINRQLAHYSYHVGQIVYVSKMLKDTEWNSLSIPKKKN
jgi:Protein of unknown function (DUF1572)